MRLLGWLLALPVSLLAVVFAVANRHGLRLELWPLPWSVEVPVYLAVLGPLVLGLMLGALVAWLGGHSARMAAGYHRRRAESLERQLAAAGGSDDKVSAPQLPPPAGG